MRQFLPFLLFTFLIPTLHAQGIGRESILGHVQVPVNEEPDGISVYNISAKTGTSTNENGDFQISVALNDSLMISAVQFETFQVVIDEKVITSKQLFIYVKELVNRLPEVVVSPYDLTGNLKTDLENANAVNLPQDGNTKPLNNVYLTKDLDPETRQVPNAAVSMSQTRLHNGLNFVNLFKLLLINNKHESVVSPYSNIKSERIDEQIRSLYNDDFFRQNLNIDLIQINDFIYYADDHGLSEQMLKKGNELDLIEFLVVQSKQYKKDILKK